MPIPVDLRAEHLEIVQGILREHSPVGVKVWVFGSRVNWTAKDSSDLDLALESESMLSHKLLGALKDTTERLSLLLRHFAQVEEIGRALFKTWFSSRARHPGHEGNIGAAVRSS